MSKNRVSFKKKVKEDLVAMISAIAVIEDLLKQENIDKKKATSEISKLKNIMVQLITK